MPAAGLLHKLTKPFLPGACVGLYLVTHIILTKYVNQWFGAVKKRVKDRIMANRGDQRNHERIKFEKLLKSLIHTTHTHTHKITSH